MNQELKEEVATLIASSNENIEAAFTILENVEAIKIKLMDNFRISLEEVALELNLKIWNEIDLKKEYSAVGFYREGWLTASIAFGFQKYSKWLFYGIVVDEPKEFDPKIRELIVNIKSADMKTSDWWPAFREFEPPYNNWNASKQVWTAVADGTMKNEFKHRIIEFLELLDANKISL